MRIFKELFSQPGKALPQSREDTLLDLAAIAVATSKNAQEGMDAGQAAAQQWTTQTGEAARGLLVAKDKGTTIVLSEKGRILSQEKGAGEGFMAWRSQDASETELTAVNAWLKSIAGEKIARDITAETWILIASVRHKGKAKLTDDDRDAVSEYLGHAKSYRDRAEASSLWSKEEIQVIARAAVPLCRGAAQTGALLAKPKGAKIDMDAILSKVPNTRT